MMSLCIVNNLSDLHVNNIRELHDDTLGSDSSELFSFLMNMLMKGVACRVAYHLHRVDSALLFHHTLPTDVNI